MKLKNKKTGEIVSFQGELIYNDKVRLLTHCNSLAELSAEWEDVPEEYYFINSVGGVIRPSDTTDWEQQDAEYHKEIGNYFNKREEAEKALEKLKAWKRLKDKGFRFDGWNGTQVGSNISYISEFYYEGCADDMDLIFGGEE